MNKFRNTFSIGAFGIGADVFGSLNLTEHFGLYANFGLRYLFAGAAEAEILGVKSDGNLKGNVAVLPSLGVMWKF